MVDRMNKHQKNNSSLVIDSKALDKAYKRLDPDQVNFYEAAFKYPMVCCNAPAGCGKTLVAVLASLELLNEGIIDKIYYIRIPDDRSLRLGFLPGTEDEKQYIYTAPFYDACSSLGIQPEMIDDAKIDGTIVTCTDIVMRGMNINKSSVIIDESQNGRLSDLKLILTRLSDNCKCFLLGHAKQYDNFKGENDHAFERYIEHLCTQSWAINCKLTKNHRGKISQWADNLV